jgi:hypothetical protein
MRNHNRCANTTNLPARWWARIFLTQPSSGPAFVQMAAQFYEELQRNSKRLPLVAALHLPVKVIWGEYDPHLSVVLRQGTRLPLQTRFVSFDAMRPLGVGRSRSIFYLYARAAARRQDLSATLARKMLALQGPGLPPSPPRKGDPALGGSNDVSGRQ